MSLCAYQYDVIVVGAGHAGTEAAAAAAAETAWATPEAMADAEMRIISATTNRAAAEVAGLTDNDERQQFIDNEVAAAVEKFQRTAILRAIGQGKTQIGRQLYDQAVERGTIKLQEDDLLTRTVQYGEQIDVVINSATMIFDQYPNDLAGAIDAARGMSLDGDTEKDLVAEIQRRFTTAEAINAQQREQTHQKGRGQGDEAGFGHHWGHLGVDHGAAAHRCMGVEYQEGAGGVKKG